jgi:hypothetical protein
MESECHQLWLLMMIVSMVSVIKKGNNLTIHFFNLETLSNNIIISKILLLCSKKIKWCEYLPNDI